MTPRHDIYLKEWMKTLGKRQADVARDLDWNKAKVSLLASGKQQYMRDDVNELAIYFNLRPYELLMHPDDAMALRALRADALKIAHSRDLTSTSESADQSKPKDGERSSARVSTG